MRFNEASIKMKIGDIFKPDGEYTPVGLKKSGFYQATAHNLKTSFTQEYMNLEGQIIPAEPKVFSAVEIAKACLKSNGRGINPSAFEISLITEGDKNGQLREWLKHTELREAVEECNNQFGDKESREQMMKALKNIKPLNNG